MVKLIAMMSASSRRAQAAERNVRLDPQGIYGTRSARRQNQLRRRRQLQNGLLWIVGALAAGFSLWWLFQPRQSLRGANWTRQLPFRPATPPFLASGQGSEGGAALLFTSQSGGLWRWKAAPEAPADWLSQAPSRVFNTDFAPAAMPLINQKWLFWPGGDGVLRALDLSTGAQKWRTVLDSALVCTPAFTAIGNREIVAAGDDAGHVAALDAATGALVWKANLGGAAGAAIGVVEGAALPPDGAGALAPLNAESNAESGAAFVVPLLAGTASRGGLVCLDARTGRIKWRFPGDARSQSAGMAAPLVRGQRVFWCNDEGAALCLDARNGRKIWKSFAAPSDGAAPSNGAAPASKKARGESGGALVSLRGGAALIEAAGVVTFGGNDGFLRAFDLATGAPRWKQNLGGSVRFPAQTPLFENQRMFLAAGDAPAIFLLDGATGRIVRRWATPYPVAYGLTVAGGNVYALDAGGHLQVAALK